MWTTYTLNGDYAIANELANEVGISRQTVVRAAKLGRIEAVKLGKGKKLIWLVKLDEKFLNWLKHGYSPKHAKGGKKRWELARRLAQAKKDGER